MRSIASNMPLLLMFTVCASPTAEDAADPNCDIEGHTISGSAGLIDDPWVRAGGTLAIHFKSRFRRVNRGMCLAYWEHMHVVLSGMTRFSRYVPRILRPGRRQKYPKFCVLDLCPPLVSMGCY